MPAWTYFYIIAILGSSFIALFHKNRIRSRAQPWCELFNCIFGILIFLIGYKAVTFSHPQLISTLCLAYTAFWSAIAYYDDFAWKPFCANIHQEARQAAQGVGGVEPKPYVFHEVEQSARKQYTVLMSVAVLMAIPMIYAYARVWWVYS